MGSDEHRIRTTAARRVRAYVDGFNLYYGLKDAVAAESPGTTWKWLDVEALCQAIVSKAWPDASIVMVRYFTARVSKRRGNDGAPDRQDAYLRALAMRGVDIELGRFLQKTKRRPLVSNPRRQEEFHDTEEKGSDVNLATRLLVDYFLERDAYDAAIVVSNDSDLALPVTLLRQQGLPLGVVNPHRKPTLQLWPRDLEAPHFGRKIEVADVTGSQLPDPVTDTTGRVLLSRAGNPITKPPTW